jgi:hypothetical protein
MGTHQRPGVKFPGKVVSRTHLRFETQLAHPTVEAFEILVF